MARAFTKPDAQRRADQIAAFRAELDQLQREGISAIDAGGRGAIDAHHEAILRDLAREFDVDQTAAEKRMSAGMRVASLLGAVALVAAIISFFSRIWGALDVPVQVVLVTAAPLASMAVMLVAARVETTRYVAGIFAVVACAALVMQTMLLGQLFNLRESPHVLALWGAFALAVAVPWGFGIPFGWGVAALIAYGAALTMSLTGAPWAMFFERPETVLLPAGVLLAIMRWAPRDVAPWGRGVALVALLAPFLFLSASGSTSALPWTASATEVMYQVAAVPAAVLVIAAGLRRGLPEVVQIGSVFAALFLCTRFVDWWWNWMPRYLFFLIIAALAIAWLWALGRLRRRLAGAGA